MRKRTATDELAIRGFFQEGELLVAEVQGVYADGAAALHTRSLRYGKVRSGVFVRVAGAGGGGGGGVVRSRRQVWTVKGREGAGDVDVVLGVNGFVWICRHGSVGGADGGGGDDDGRGASTAAGRKIGITRLEDGVDERMYSARNDYVSAETRRQIARLAGCVRALAESGVRVDEEMVMKVYEASFDEREGYDEDSMDVDREDEALEALEYLGGRRGRRLVAQALAVASEE